MNVIAQSLISLAYAAKERSSLYKQRCRRGKVMPAGHVLVVGVPSNNVHMASSEPALTSSIVSRCTRTNSESQFFSVSQGTKKQRPWTTVFLQRVPQNVSSHNATQLSEIWFPHAKAASCSTWVLALQCFTPRRSFPGVETNELQVCRSVLFTV